MAALLRLARPVTALKKSGLACFKTRSLTPPKGTLLWFCTPKILW